VSASMRDMVFMEVAGVGFQRINRVGRAMRCGMTHNHKGGRLNESKGAVALRTKYYMTKFAFSKYAVSDSVWLKTDCPAVS
jgi:hypothetical protein